ncbi:hypothetical protein MPNT_140037 [Candidatus Methylacidithermus pantelleriae]|uniref:Uncharacterized protein n=1 Tax=Candidatus Methylacidithermus pantelleriae TaxID=2744239 RepID=A0A8J2BRX8_9BACT|nr:hypothetical protein MPNT_140037 [Candidatus Methylacidithermus pantelleriae]
MGVGTVVIPFLQLVDNRIGLQDLQRKGSAPAVYLSLMCDRNLKARTALSETTVSRYSVLARLRFALEKR